MKTSTHLALFAAGALGIAAFATAAVAQDYPDEDSSYSDEDSNYDDNANYDDNSDSDEDADYADNEEIVVSAPHFAPTDARGMGQRVALSQPVSYSDIDLRTRHGAHILRARIRDTARQICTQLDAAYPGPGGETQACMRDASRNAMNEADDIIADARGVAYNDEY